MTSPRAKRESRGASPLAADPPANLKLRLYVAGGAPSSELARINLNAMCKSHLPKDCEIEVVDVMLELTRAIADGVRLTPTLQRVTPHPIKRIVGTLSEPLRVLSALGLTGRVE